MDDPDDTDDTDPADETCLMPASQSTEIIGDCEMVLTQVTTDPETGKVTGVEASSVRLPGIAATTVSHRWWAFSGRCPRNDFAGNATVGTVRWASGPECGLP